MCTEENPPVAPVLQMHVDAYLRIMRLIRECPGEVNGFAFLARPNAQTLVLAAPADVFITDQVVTTGSADAERGAVALAHNRAAQEGRAAQLKLQWHSHPGKAYFSFTDMATVHSYGPSGFEWFVSLVFDRDGGFEARFDVYRPVRLGVPIQVTLFGDDDEQQTAAVRAELMRHVQRRVLVGKAHPGKVQATRDVPLFDHVAGGR